MNLLYVEAVSEHRFHDLLRAARSAWHRWFTVVVGKCRSIQVRSTAGSSIPTDRPIIIFTVLGGILTAGFLLRLISIIAVPNINQADEVFQTLEQAHRIVYGFGIVPWEFEVGARSFLMPGALAALMWASRLFDAGPIYYLLVVHAMLSLLSTACILVVFLWGERFFGSITALVCAGIVAFSTDLIYFGPRASPEVVSAHLVLVACYFAEPGFRAQSKSRLSLAGVLLGLGFALRIQLAPAIAFFVLWTGWRSWRDRLMPILIGALSVILLAGILDWVTWGYPFESSWRYVDYNLFHGMQRDFGVNPWYQYADYLLFYWGPGIALLVLLGIVGSVYVPVLVIMAVIVALEHTFIAHKEFRFIYPAVLFGVVLAAIGAGSAVSWMARQLPRFRVQLAIAALFFWFVFSVGEAASGGYRARWTRGNDELRAALSIARLPSVCGVGLFNVALIMSGGYTYMHFAGHLYTADTQSELERQVTGFNALIYQGSLPAGLGFRHMRCFHEVCLATRDGSCWP